MDQLLNSIGADHKRFRDPIYGYIHLTKKEHAIIDTPLFQRLRRVHQLALTKYVYPTAEHSRFVHSLGVMHCATAMYIGLCEHELSVLETVDHINHLRLLRYAALLHDVGHLPFSHAAEKELLNGSTHEDLGRHIISANNEFVNILEDDAKAVANILSKEVRSKHNLIHQIVSGQLDSDRADYLMRDSHACGVKYGEYDRNRYMQAFGAISGDGSFSLCVNERDIFVIEGFLMARYHYNLQVPFHRTRTGFDLVLRKYFSVLQERGMIGSFFDTDELGNVQAMDFEYFEDFDDYRVYEWIKEDYRRGDPWAKILLRLDHLRPVLDVSDGVKGASKQFKALIEAFEKQGFRENEDYFACRTEVEVSKLARKAEEGHPDAESEKPALSVRRRDGSLADIADFSQLVGKLNKPLTLYRVYAPAWTLEKVARVKAKVLKIRPAKQS